MIASALSSASLTKTSQMPFPQKASANTPRKKVVASRSVRAMKAAMACETTESMVQNLHAFQIDTDRHDTGPSSGSDVRKILRQNVFFGKPSSFPSAIPVRAEGGINASKQAHSHWRRSI
jgi:hypothetical protein